MKVNYFIRGGFIYALLDKRELFASGIGSKDCQYINITQWNQGFSPDPVYHQLLPDTYATLINKRLPHV